MRISSQQFIDSKRKIITLMGMSGVGKTTLAHKLPRSHWFHYSADYRIGSFYLSEPIIDNLKIKAMDVPFLKELLMNDSIYIGNNISFNNLSILSTFLGKIGDPKKHGLNRQEFKRRQALHRNAEINAMYDVSVFMEKASKIYQYPHFINDASGSICELNDEKVLQHLAKHSIILYLKASPQLINTLVERAIANPKPIYYQANFLDKQLDIYLKQNNLSTTDQIDPNQFVQWIFPKSIEHRQPLYQAIADKYGYTIDANLIYEIKDEQDAIDLIAKTLKS